MGRVEVLPTRSGSASLFPYTFPINFLLTNPTELVKVGRVRLISSALEVTNGFSLGFSLGFNT